MIASWTNSDYETFASDGTEITSAIETGVSGNASSSTFTITDGQVMTVILDLTHNSGSYPLIIVKDLAGNNITNGETLVSGLNEVDLTLTTTGSGSGKLWLINSTATNYSTSEVMLSRKPRKFVFNKGSFNVIDREWQTDLIEII